jgi:hypothetical protein
MTVIIEEIKNIRSGKNELRQFGIIIAIACCLLGVLLWWRGKTYCYYSFIIAAAFLVTGFTLPAALKPFHKMWMTLSILMGWVMTRLILIILFYGILTLIGLLARLCGKDFLDVKIDKNAPSYWVLRGKPEYDKKSYERQF